MADNLQSCGQRNTRRSSHQGLLISMHTSNREATTEFRTIPPHALSPALLPSSFCPAHTHLKLSCLPLRKPRSPASSTPAEPFFSFRSSQPVSRPRVHRPPNPLTLSCFDRYVSQALGLSLQTTEPASINTRGHVETKQPRKEKAPHLLHRIGHVWHSPSLLVAPFPSTSFSISCLQPPAP